jgi:hypothetical protein
VKPPGAGPLRAQRYAGGEAVYTPHLLERAVRDLHTATQHVLASDVAYEDHAKHLLGLADSPPAGLSA